MTKDNWIKAFDKLAPAFDWRGYPSRTSVINFISQVEKDAIEKTNKRWREKVEKQKQNTLYAKIARENRELRANPPCYKRGKIGKI